MLFPNEALTSDAARLFLGTNNQLYGTDNKWAFYKLKKDEVHFGWENSCCDLDQLDNNSWMVSVMERVDSDADAWTYANHSIVGQ